MKVWYEVWKLIYDTKRLRISKRFLFEHQFWLILAVSLEMKQLDKQIVGLLRQRNNTNNSVRSRLSTKSSTSSIASFLKNNVHSAQVSSDKFFVL